MLKCIIASKSKQTLMFLSSFCCSGYSYRLQTLFHLGALLGIAVGLVLVAAHYPRSRDGVSCWGWGSGMCPCPGMLLWMLALLLLQTGGTPDNCWVWVGRAFTGCWNLVVSEFQLPFNCWPGEGIFCNVLLDSKASLDDAENFLGGCFGHESFQLPV